MGTNGTHRSHARCHPYPIPQPVKVGHTTGVYVPYSFRTVVWVLLRPTWTDQWKCCETGPTVICPYPKRLASLRDGPLEKWWGGGEILAVAVLLFMSLTVTVLTLTTTCKCTFSLYYRILIQGGKTQPLIFIVGANNFIEYLQSYQILIFI